MEEIIKSLGYDVYNFYEIQDGWSFEVDGISFLLFLDYDLIARLPNGNKEFHLKNDLYFCALFPEIMEHLNEY